MKNVLIFGLIIMAMPAMAAGPSTSCPSGYVAIEQPNVTLADSTCPTGKNSAGSASSCLGTAPDGACYMYAPTDASYSDNKGTYKYTSLCELS